MGEFKLLTMFEIFLDLSTRIIAEFLGLSYG